MAYLSATDLRPVGVGSVGLLPDESTGLPPGLPQRPEFRLVAFSDEGLPETAPPRVAAAYWRDYNRLLQMREVELVVVGGPVELRRDFAVRALNAGKHAVLLMPFCESALDAERVLKTALRHGLIATADMTSRDEPNFRSLRYALREENAGPVQGLFYFHSSDAVGESGLLAQVGLDMFDQLNLVLDRDVASVMAHLHRQRPDGPDHSFMLYMPLRGGGWAVCHAARQPDHPLPRWLLLTRGATFTTVGGQTTVTTDLGQRTYDNMLNIEDFWSNLYAAIRGGVSLKCHPAEIVRAMKLQEAAFRSAETGEPAVL